MNIKKIFLFTVTFFLFSMVFATGNWLAGNGLDWIAKTEEPYNSRFKKIGILDGVETIVDNFTNLKWEEIPSEEKMNYDIASSYCSQKGNGWRMPTIQELRTIVSYKIKNENSAYTSHKNIKNGGYWTSNHQIFNQKDYFGEVFFGDGNITFEKKSDGNNFIEDYVICIHD